MKMNVLPIIAFVLSIDLVIGQGTCPQGFEYWPENGYCYAYVSILKSFHDADDYCGNQAAGGFLASTHSMAEEGYVQSLVQTTDRYWLGANDVGTEEVFTWTDGSPMDWKNWDCGEPNDSLFADEDCVEGNVGDSKRWNDEKCDEERVFVCKAPQI
ncbi:C-type lectin lectoxin-Lio2-like [Saccoglossus kowalevskii]|uniref:C-type lectin lectoxin-Lio2-like n=1 Tax=Saccoglossus kowalevskii TaxID=10224 RepID=A0ABM0MLG8_SACKO|nr:PREDICTED: C-type lectin lectoxin-Lio2-like [Saccoglossus kowalevskii]